MTTTTSALQMVHFVPGRLRVKLPRLKGDVLMAREVQQALASMPGIQEVEVSTLTGSVLVFYDTALSRAWSMESLTPLLTLAEPLGLSPKTLPMDDVQRWFHLTSNGTRPLPPGALESNLGGLFGGLSAGVGQLSTGLGDVRTFIPLTLLLLGLRSFLVTDKLPFPSWYDYLWFAFGTYMALQPQPVRPRES